MKPPLPHRRPFQRPPWLSWTPFGPGDRSTLDDAAKLKIVNDAQDVKARLEAELANLEKTRQGEGRPPASSGDEHPPEPTPVTRANSFLPFLLIRSFLGDIGARPVSPTQIEPSPDVIVAFSNPGYLKTILGRGDVDEFYRTNNIIVGNIGVPSMANPTLDIWVHVWNLGRAPAHGVRVRAWIPGSYPGVAETFMGGREVDLGDRTSSTSHLMVKVGSWIVDRYAAPLEIQATAECLLDVAGAGRDGRKDRHSAHFLFGIIPVI